MLKLIEISVSIKWKKALTKESQEAGSFFCPLDQKVWCTHAGIFKAFPDSLFHCPVCATGRFKLWGFCCCPKLFRDQVQGDEQKTQVRRFGRDVCAVEGILQSVWTCLPTRQCEICRKGTQQSLLSGEGHQQGLTLCLKPKGTIHTRQKFPSWGKWLFSPFLTAACGVFTSNQCSWRHFARCLRFLKTAVKKKFLQKSQLSRRWNPINKNCWTVLLHHCWSHEGQSCCSRATCAGCCKASLAVWSLGEDNHVNHFLCSSCCDTSQQTALLPFHAQCACLGLVLFF